MTAAIYDGGERVPQTLGELLHSLIGEFRQHERQDNDRAERTERAVEGIHQRFSSLREEIKQDRLAAFSDLNKTIEKVQKVADDSLAKVEKRTETGIDGVKKGVSSVKAMIWGGLTALIVISLSVNGWFLAEKLSSPKEQSITSSKK